MRTVLFWYGTAEDEFGTYEEDSPVWFPGARPFVGRTLKRHYARRRESTHPNDAWRPRLDGYRRLPRKLKRRTEIVRRLRSMRRLFKATYSASLKSLVPPTSMFSMPIVGALTPENGFTHRSEK